MLNLWFILWRNIVLKLMFLVMVSSDVTDAKEAHFLQTLNMNFAGVKYDKMCFLFPVHLM